MSGQSSSIRSRTIAAMIAGITTLIVGAFVVSACGRTGIDSAGAFGAPGQNTSTTVVETTTLPPTTLPPTTTTTTAAWPKGPVLTIPAAGAVPVISTIATADPVVFLTIDDGNVRDPRVPELLAQFKVPATLFLNQGPFLTDPDYFFRVSASGGTINSHTKSHTQLTRLSAASQRNEICGMRDIIGQHMFVPGHLFRAPYGVSNGATQTAAGSCGINAVLYWHAALNDGRIQYQQGNQLQPGDIILTHFRSDLYDNIRALLWQCALQGLTIAPIEDYLPLPAGG
ncbi:MAG: polysaccharide deacetylase family protein [Actinobacteria bacterium]|nr:polysaccharide deacetylase family protein [Actinomycetota bacterium]